MERDKDNTQKSIGLSLADDEKIKLIDILSEDDNDFLVASPFSDALQQYSFPDNTGEDGRFGLSGWSEKSQEIRPRRPSFMRRSLAWDSAFLDSAGILDPDELSFINKGYGTPPDICNRRSDSRSLLDAYGSCSDWFEIEPIESNKVLDVVNKSTVKSGLKDEGSQNFPAVKKAEKSFANKNKSKITSTRNGMATTSSPHPPKAMTGVSTRPNRKKLPSRTVSESKNPGLSESLSASVSKSYGWKIAQDKKKTHGGSVMHNGAKGASDFESNLCTPLALSRTPRETTPVGSVSVISNRPSCLRPPSPNIRFFDENAPPNYRAAATRRKTPGEVLPKGTPLGANTPLSSSNSRNTITSKAGHMDISHDLRANKETRSGTHKSRHGKRPRNKLGQMSSWEEEETKRSAKRNSSCSVDQLGNLSRCFEAIDLNQESLYPQDTVVASTSCTRTPLAHRTSLY